MRNYEDQAHYTAVPSSNESAVFRTTAEISAQLVYHGNIKHPMDLRALGRVMALGTHGTNYKNLLLWQK